MIKVMVRKSFIYLFIFLFLLATNLYLVYSLNLKKKKNQSTQKILNEIGRSFNPQEQFKISSSPFVLGAYETKIEVADGRVANLKSFLRKYNSPLYDYADLIVKVSDKYQFDYRLLVAIAMQESNVCKVIPENSYNCWGWGIYGDKIIRFNSYEEAIETVAKGIKQQYIDKGLITASAIMKKYTPSSNGSWAFAVNSFLRMLE